MMTSNPPFNLSSPGKEEGTKSRELVEADEEEEEKEECTADEDGTSLLEIRCFLVAKGEIE